MGASARPGMVYSEICHPKSRPGDLASAINELAEVVNGRLLTVRTFQAETSVWESRFISEQIDEVADRRFVDCDYFTVGEIIVAL
jgi:hypothetical protein